jgi:predicted transposase YdaD
VWQRPADDFVNAPIGLVPLAPLADVRESALPSLVERMRKRIARRSHRPLAAKLWSASYVLMGLRYETALIESLLSGVRQMEESVTYQAIIRRGEKKGREQGLREEALRMLLLAAQPKLGAPGKPIRAALDAITDVTRFERLAARITTASSWSELLKSN